MRFKSFEVRPLPDKDRYELVKYASDGSYCWVVSFIEWDGHEEDWHLNNVGYRYLEDREDGLEEFLLAYLELMRICKRANEQEEIYCL